MTKLKQVNGKTKKNITTISLLSSLLPFKIVHIKKTKNGKHFNNYYWNNRTKEIIFGNGSLKTKNEIPSFSEIFKYNESTNDLSRREIQIGDSVGILFNTTVAPFLFGSVVGLDIDTSNEEKYYHILPHDSNFPYAEKRAIKVKYEHEKFFLLKNGVNERYDKFATKNLAFARYQYQLDFAEIVTSYMYSYKLVKLYAENDKIPIGEIALKQCHKSLFGRIYDWAGEYREDIIVVGNRERPTMDHNDIKRTIKSCLRGCNKSEMDKIENKRDLVLKLAQLHSELAWIHPFQDGNGRTIRLFLQILAVTMGYDFDMTVLDGCVKNKRAYHYAVRRAIHDNKRNLIALLNKAIREIKQS
ncbi:Fic family protein [Yersinia ruckeri]|uniref:Fic family protein n=1 Tax=Yersinia ruckeri TaxID=29486 RepID=UPI0020BF59C5|nr:Fic family protein [Yersinia ruckeri]MCW6525946.1 Fic family protein [Yersinia ruckeri]MCW6560759.1 Fic family protein [Yersinia ruckeri]UZY03575.1 Fic family protein [Yersinia ruckeri]